MKTVTLIKTDRNGKENEVQVPAILAKNLVDTRENFKLPEGKKPEDVFLSEKEVEKISKEEKASGKYSRKDLEKKETKELDEIYRSLKGLAPDYGTERTDVINLILNAQDAQPRTDQPQAEVPAKSKAKK